VPRGHGKNPYTGESGKQLNAIMTNLQHLFSERTRLLKSLEDQLAKWTEQAGFVESRFGDPIFRERREAIVDLKKDLKAIEKALGSIQQATKDVTSVRDVFQADFLNLEYPNV